MGAGVPWIKICVIDSARALLAINYPNVYEDSPLNTSEIKWKLDAAYKVFNSTNKAGMTSFLLSDQAKTLFEEARDRLASYKVRYTDNGPILSAATNMAKSAQTEDPVKGLLANCPSKERVKIKKVRLEGRYRVKASATYSKKWGVENYDLDLTNLPNSDQWLPATLIREGTTVYVTSRGCGSGLFPTL